WWFRACFYRARGAIRRPGTSRRRSRLARDLWSAVRAWSADQTARAVTALPGISILMPTLNAERYLEGALKSIRSQDYPAELIEIIVADAGSTDSTLALLERY